MIGFFVQFTAKGGSEVFTQVWDPTKGDFFFPVPFEGDTGSPSEIVSRQRDYVLRMRTARGVEATIIRVAKVEIPDEMAQAGQDYLHALEWYLHAGPDQVSEAGNHLVACFIRMQERSKLLTERIAAAEN